MRQEAGLSQEEVGAALGRPQSYVSRYERGDRRLDVIEFIDVARVLGTSAAKLLKELEPDA